ncbi:hypothetical protein JK364_40730 [Streptomyces sp. 110]|uniref:Uncharacterized protein n=1 Tax=Streptomyces endocoffeicus TaxID=2898945 RepID=A0ABS1Q1V0_9ACTN|nr:hypothetical protein [Streptomyces endocoffeicus]MBL1118651.1 hypothetical protein [Streptomyces endocoffeicus]
MRAEQAMDHPAVLHPGVRTATGRGRGLSSWTTRARGTDHAEQDDTAAQWAAPHDDGRHPPAMADPDAVACVIAVLRVRYGVAN